MKTKILRSSRATLLVFTILLAVSWTRNNGKPNKEFYKLIVYHFSTADQEKTIDAYLGNAFVPAMHRIGIASIGVFKSHGNDTLADKTMYVLVPMKSTGMVEKIQEKLDADRTYQEAGANYLDAAYTAPPYTRMETVLLTAFPMAPTLSLPSLKGPRRERFYELRSYEGPTEAIFKNKVRMFNDGDEIGLFKRLNFNAIFYGEVLAGSKMPNLMYMTSFENRTDRDAHWKTFGNDPYWKELSAKPEYQHNVSHIDITWLYPTEYSDY
jgi:hypothetical protein